MRRQEEFYCSTAGGGCGKYFLTFLRDSMFGNYTIECPNPECPDVKTQGHGHHHYRVIKQGLVTEDRHNEKLGKSTIVMGLASTVRDKPWHDEPDFNRRQLVVLQ